MLEFLVKPLDLQKQIIQYFSYPDLLRSIADVNTNRLYEQSEEDCFTETEISLLTHFNEHILNEIECSLELYNGDSCRYSCVLTPVKFDLQSLTIEFAFDNASEWIDNSPIKEFVNGSRYETKSQHQLKKEKSERKWYNNEVKTGKLFPDRVFTHTSGDEDDEEGNKRSFHIQLTFTIPRPELTNQKTCKPAFETQSILLPDVEWSEEDFESGCHYSDLPDLYLSCGGGCAPDSLKFRITPTFLVRLWNTVDERKEMEKIECNPLSVSTVGIQRIVAESKLLAESNNVSITTRDIQFWALKCPTAAAEIDSVYRKKGSTSKAASAIGRIVSAKKNAFDQLTKRYESTGISRKEMIVDLSSLLMLASLHNETFQDFSC